MVYLKSDLEIELEHMENDKSECVEMQLHELDQWCGTIQVPNITEEI